MPEYKGQLLYLYTDGQVKISIAGKVYPLKLWDYVHYPSTIKSAVSGDKIFISVDSPLRIMQVIVRGKSVFATTELTFGLTTSFEHNGDLITLKDGSLLYCWYYYNANEWGFNLRFAYRNVQGQWSILPDITHINASGMYGSDQTHDYNHVTMSQDLFGGIWVFSQQDSNSVIAAVHLSLVNNFPVIDWGNSAYIFGCEGEFPYLTSMPYEDGVAIAYENGNYQIFSSNPFIKGAQISVTKVSRSTTPTTILTIPQYVERISVIGMGQSSNGLWVLYQPINEDNISNPNIAIQSNNGTKTIENVALNNIAFSAGNKIAYSQYSGNIIEATI